MVSVSIYNKVGILKKFTFFKIIFALTLIQFVVARFIYRLRLVVNVR